MEHVLYRPVTSHKHGDDLRCETLNLNWSKHPVGTKRLGLEADHRLPASAEVKNTCIYTTTPIRLHAILLNYKHRDNIYWSKPQEIGWEDVDWIRPAQDMDQWAGCL
jgi:hypothetical protein